jgi:RNA polymerase sigma-70 factor (ECF subfamily)
MTSLSDLSLVTQVAVFGNRNAFDKLVVKYQSQVRRFFLHQTMGDGQLSDDLAQDTFIKAYVNIRQFRGTASFSTWLMRIAYNVFYDYCRKEQTHPQPIPEGRGADTAASGSRAQGIISPPSQGWGGGGSVSLRLDIMSALAILKPDERMCITLQLIDGRPIDEIASITGMPSGTVKSHLSRGKEKLATYLKQNGYERK